MLSRLKKLDTPLFRDSSIYYLGNFFLNFFRYLFHLLLLRLLSPEDYGEFLTYLSLMYLLAIPSGTITGVVTKAVSEFVGKKDGQSLNLFFYQIIKKTFLATLLLSICLLAFSGYLSVIFKAHQLAFIVLGIGVILTLFQTVSSSYLSGLQLFVFQTILGFLGVILTISISFLAIRMGYGPGGAVIGQTLAALITTLIAYLKIKKYIYPLKKGKVKFLFNLKNFTGFSFINSVGVMSLISVDILMVRALLSLQDSGIYSTLSVISRTVLFGLTPISSLLLPIAAKKASEGKNHFLVFLKLGLVMVILSSIAIAIFSFFPKFIIHLFSGASHPTTVFLLPIFALCMVLFALNQFLLTYLMSINKQKSNLFLLIIALAQPALIYLFKYSLHSVVLCNLFLQITLLTTLMVVYLKPISSSVKNNNDYVS